MKQNQMKTVYEKIREVLRVYGNPLKKRDRLLLQLVDRTERVSAVIDISREAKERQKANPTHKA